MTSLKLFGLYYALWIIISGGVIELFPTFFILFLSLITPSIFTLSYKRISPLAVLRLAFWFLIYSIKGGLQVALMALSPKMTLEPFIYTHHLKIDNAFSISLLANIYSLMPGTLSIKEEDGKILLHILDKSLFEIALVERFEDYVFTAFEKEAPR